MFFVLFRVVLDVRKFAIIEVLRVFCFFQTSVGCQKVCEYGAFAMGVVLFTLYGRLKRAGLVGAYVSKLVYKK